MDLPVFSSCDFIAGWGAGIFGLLIGHPLDTIKVRQQIFDKASGVHIFLKTVKFEGVYGFYKGMGAPLLAAGALNSLFFGSYGISLRYLEKYHRPSDPEDHGSKYIPYSYSNIFFAGAMGGVVTCSLSIPVDLIKIQLQTQTGLWETKHKMKHINPLKMFSKILRKHGLKGLYHGGLAMLYRESFSYGIYIVSYAHMMDLMQANMNVLTVSLAGGVAGVLCWALIMPLDVIKSRLQADDLSAPEYNGMTDCAAKIYKKHGLTVFGRGFIMCSLRSFPVNAATFVGFEWSLKWCNDFSEKYLSS